MAKVICTLDNASTLINGVKFTADRGQMISEEITDEAATAFAAIPGYKLVAAKAAKGAPPATPEQPVAPAPGPAAPAAPVVPEAKKA